MRYVSAQVQGSLLAGLASAARVPLSVVALAAGGLVYEIWRWRAALERAAAINGTDAGLLRAAYPFSRVCADPALVFDACGRAAAYRGLVIGGLIVLAIFAAFAATARLRLRRPQADAHAYADAAASTFRLSLWATAAAIAAGMTAGLLAVRHLPPRPGAGFGVAIGLGGLLYAGRMAWAAFGRDPGPERIDGTPLDATRTPRLFAIIQDVATQLGVPFPDHVVAGLDRDVFATTRPLLLGGDRLFGVTLYVSLPLCRSLDADELRAVLAYALAHVQPAAGALDARVAPVETRAMRTLWAGGLAASSLIEAFVRILLHSSVPIRRARERHVDGAMVRVAGARAAAAATVKLGLVEGVPEPLIEARVRELGADRAAAWLDARRTEPDRWTLLHDWPEIEAHARATELGESPRGLPAWLLGLRPLAALAGLIAVSLGAAATRPRIGPPAPSPPVRAIAARGQEPMPDPVALLADLRAGNYDALDAAMVDAVQRSRTSPRDELVSEVAFRAFQIQDERIAPQLDAWIAQLPRSAVARAARAQYLSGRGWDARGTAYGYQTPKAQRDEARRLFRLATADAEEALARDPHLVDAHAILLNICRMTDGCDAAAHRGLARAPASYRLRRLYLYALLPRWGGSYRDMRAFALASLPHADQNPRLHALGGFVDWDLGQLASERGDDIVAFQHHERALAYGPEVDVRRARASLQMRHKAYRDALVEIDAALQLRPDDAELLSRRAVLLAAVGRVEEAVTVFARAEQLDPAQPRLAEDRVYIARVASRRR